MKILKQIIGLTKKRIKDNYLIKSNGLLLTIKPESH